MTRELWTDGRRTVSLDADGTVVIQIGETIMHADPRTPPSIRGAEQMRRQGVDPRTHVAIPTREHQMAVLPSEAWIAVLDATRKPAPAKTPRELYEEACRDLHGAREDLRDAERRALHMDDESGRTSRVGPEHQARVDAATARVAELAAAHPDVLAQIEQEREENIERHTWD